MLRKRTEVEDHLEGRGALFSGGDKVTDVRYSALILRERTSIAGMGSSAAEDVDGLMDARGTLWPQAAVITPGLRDTVLVLADGRKLGITITNVRWPGPVACFVCNGGWL